MSQTLDALPLADENAVRAGVEANIADLAVDRHVRAGHGGDIALRWIGPDRADLDDPLDLSFETLASRTTRFAGALRHQGIGPGAVVATLLGRVPDLYVAAVGTWKARGVLAVLSPSCSTDVVAARLGTGHVQVLVTTPVLFRRAVAPVLHRLPALELVLVCGASEDHTASARSGHHARVMSCGAFVRESNGDFAVESTHPDDPATLRFTSRWTGALVPHVDSHRRAAVQHRTGRLALGLDRGDTFWCTADPDSITRISDGTIGAMAAGARSIVDESDIDPARWWQILRRHRVDVLCTSPAALRVLRESAGGDDRGGELPLRLVATVGEPLDAATAAWVGSSLGVPVLDTSSLEQLREEGRR